MPGQGQLTPSPINLQMLHRTLPYQGIRPPRDEDMCRRSSRERIRKVNFSAAICSETPVSRFAMENIPVAAACTLRLFKKTQI